MRLDEYVFRNSEKLNESDVLIWNYIANHKAECVELSIEALAQRCLVSRTTILRFAKKIGLDGYSELKYLLKEELRQKWTLNEKDRKELCEKHIRTIQILEDVDMKPICEMLFQAKRVFAFGRGFFVKSSMQIFKEEMFKADLIVNLLPGTGEMCTFLENAREGDVVVIFSISGENKGTNEYVEIARTKGVKIIAITADVNSTLCNHADEVLNFAPFMLADLKKDNTFFPISILIFTIELLLYEYCYYLQEKD